MRMLYCGAELFEKEWNAVASYYPKISLVMENGSVRLVGELDLVDTSGVQHDTYHIEVVPLSNYPDSFPLVYEKAGRIPNNIDWHVHTDGNFCIKTIPEEIITCRKGITLLYFIEEEIKPYLYNQTFRSHNGYFLNERSHGIYGDIEFYQELFLTKSIISILSYMIFFLDNPEPSRVSPCFCGSSSKYRNCHRQAYRTLLVIGKNVLLNFIIRILQFNLIDMENPPMSILLRRFIASRYKDW